MKIITSSADNTRHGIAHSHFEKDNEKMKRMLGQDWFLLFEFQRVNCFHLADVDEKQYTCEATIVPSMALDDGGTFTSQQMTSFRCIKVVTYMILSWPSVQFLPCFQSKSKSIPFLIESPCINIFSLAAERTFHARYAVFALETFVTITIQSVDC